jgi:sec-independent protein translocase protein TatA
MGYATALAFVHWPEVLLIVALVVLIFGATRLPAIGKGLGEGIKNFRKSLKGDEGKGIEDGKGESSE